MESALIIACMIPMESGKPEKKNLAIYTKKNSRKTKRSGYYNHFPVRRINRHVAVLLMPQKQFRLDSNSKTSRNRKPFCRFLDLSKITFQLIFHAVVSIPAGKRWKMFPWKGRKASTWLNIAFPIISKFRPKLPQISYFFPTFRKSFINRSLKMITSYKVFFPGFFFSSSFSGTESNELTFDQE